MNHLPCYRKRFVSVILYVFSHPVVCTLVGIYLRVCCYCYEIDIPKQIQVSSANQVTVFGLVSRHHSLQRVKQFTCSIPIQSHLFPCFTQESNLYILLVFLSNTEKRGATAKRYPIKCP